MKAGKALLSVLAAAVISAGTLFSGGLSFDASATWDTKDGKWYYLDEDGDKLTGFQEIDGDTYYFGSDGVMKTGWLKLKSGKRYYFDKEGRMAAGKKTVSGKTYYFGKNGVMKTGWVTISGNKYYFKSDGSMAKSCTLKIDGKSYKFDKNGKSKISSSSSKKNTVPKELVFPDFGDSLDKVLSKSGIANYRKDSGTFEYSDCYVGEVLVNGVGSDVVFIFNSDKRLSAMLLTVPMDKSEYRILKGAFEDEFGSEYSEEDGRTYWVWGNSVVILEYVYGEGGKVFAVDFTYMEEGDYIDYV